MDYGKPAAKLFASDMLRACQVTADGASAQVGNLLFQRVWVQGIIVKKMAGSRFLLDDGSAILTLHLPPSLPPPHVGSMALVIAALKASGELKVHKIVDLDGDANRESLWNLEVAEVHRLYYMKS
jgi:hypothetical protein